MKVKVPKYAKPMTFRERAGRKPLIKCKQKDKLIIDVFTVIGNPLAEQENTVIEYLCDESFQNLTQA